MDKQSIAHLDKTDHKVMCGACHKQIAVIESSINANAHGTKQVGGPDRAFGLYTLGKCVGYHVEVENGVAHYHYLLRNLVIFWGYRLDPDGVWKLNKRTARRLRQRKGPYVRRQRRAVGFWDGDAIAYQPIRTSDPDARRNRPTLTLPIKLQCTWCGSVQLIEQETLRLTRPIFTIGSDMDDWREKYWPKNWRELREKQWQEMMDAPEATQAETEEREVA